MKLVYAEVDDAAHGGGEVEGAFALEHGEGDERFGVLGEEGGGQAAGLFAEDEVVAMVEQRLGEAGERAGGVGGEEPEAGGLLGAEERIPGDVLTRAQAGPVIKAGATAGLFGRVKAQWLDEVERAAGGDAGAADVAGVVGDLGFVEDDMKHAGDLAFGIF